MDCQGAQEEPGGRTGGPWDPKTAKGVLPRPFTFHYLSLVLLAFLLALRGLPGNLSSLSNAIHILKPAVEPPGEAPELPRGLDSFLGGSRASRTILGSPTASEEALGLSRKQ